MALVEVVCILLIKKFWAVLSCARNLVGSLFVRDSERDWEKSTPFFQLNHCLRGSLWKIRNPIKALLIYAILLLFYTTHCSMVELPFLEPLSIALNQFKLWKKFKVKITLSFEFFYSFFQDSLGSRESIGEFPEESVECVRMLAENFFDEKCSPSWPSDDHRTSKSQTKWCSICLFSVHFIVPHVCLVALRWPFSLFLPSLILITLPRPIEPKPDNYQMIIWLCVFVLNCELLAQEVSKCWVV